MIFRAVINKNAPYFFTLKQLVDPDALPYIRESVIPWLLADNIPDRGLGVCDTDDVLIFENDIVQAVNYPGKGQIIYNEDAEAGACFLPQFDDDSTIDWWQEKERWYELRVIGRKEAI